MDEFIFPKIEITFAPLWWQQNYGMDFSSSAFWHDPILFTERDREQRRLLFERFGHVGLGEADPKPNPVVGGEFGHRFMSAFWGCEVVYLSDQWPHAAAFPDAYSCMQELVIPEVDNSPAVQLLFTNARLLEEKYGKCRAAINYGGPLNNAVSVLGEAIFVLCAENPSLAQQVLFQMAEANLAVYDGVECRINRTGLHQTRQRNWEIGNCPVSQISPRMYRNVVMVVDQWLSEQFQGEFWLHHCGLFHPYIDVYKPLEPRALDVGPGTDLRLTCQAYPDARVSVYIDPASLPQMDRDEIDTLVTQMVIDANSPGYFELIRVAEIGPEIQDETVNNLMTVFERIQANL